MNQLSMRRMTGTFGLAPVGLWLALFPLYTVQPPASLYDGAATAQALYTIRNVAFTRVLLGAALYVTLMVFAVGFRDLVRRADADYVGRYRTPAAAPTQFRRSRRTSARPHSGQLIGANS
jgi:hypothetical protein